MKKCLPYLLCVSRLLWSGSVLFEADAFLPSSSRLNVPGRLVTASNQHNTRLRYEPLPNDSLGNFAENMSSPTTPSPPTTNDNDFPIHYDVDISGPNPQLSALDVTTLLMDALQNTANPRESLALCFAFSSDPCRAALGGDLDAFVRYANNPTFGALVHCQHFVVRSVGPIIPGSMHRGDMQTVLVEITRPLTVQQAIDAKRKEDRKTGRRRPTVEERMRARRQEYPRSGGHIRDAEITDRNPMNGGAGDDTKTYLWTLQKERRPPRQGCWLVHEVLYNKNAFMQTM
jgi:hypothetical protein